MKKLQNVLYILTPDSYLYIQGECICVKVAGEERVRVPSHTIQSIVFLTNTTISSPLVRFCGETGITVSFLDDFGRFQGRLYGKTSGNVLLRMKQYQSTGKDDFCSNIVCAIISSKIVNSRNMLQRAAREQNDEESAILLKKAAEEITKAAQSLSPKMSVDYMRGIEGLTANYYFGVFDYMIKVNKNHFFLKNRNRRPPEDKTNAILSFLYALLKNDICSALETVGLDPAVGWLHAVRPGRPSLALDLMEELRSPLCDRLAISLINLRQIQPNDFESEINSVKMTDSGKKTVIETWQKRKQEEIIHPFLNEKIKIGLIPHIQAQLLSRFLRGDIEAYPPFIWR
jgi:CRISPR-associated protein Cas1